MARVNVHGHSPAHVWSRFGPAGFAPNEFARAGLAEFRAVRMFGALMNVKHFQSRAIRVHVRKMQRIAVAKPR